MPQLVSEIVQRWATARGLGLPHPNTITELVSLEGGPGRGGGTRRAARALGLPLGTKTEIASSERFIQRRMQYEAGAGTTKQARPGRKSGGKEITQEQIRKAIGARNPDARLKKYGIEVSFVQARMGKSNKWEPAKVGEPGRVVTDVDIPGDALDAFLEAIGKGDWDEAARQLEEQWQEAYPAPILWDDEWGIRDGKRVHIPIVDALSMEIGAGGIVRRRRRSS